MNESGYITAFAPASIGNVGVGFDMLGLAVSGVGDRVSIRRTDAPGVKVVEVRDRDGEVHPHLSTDSGKNTASIAAAALWTSAAAEGGLEIIVQKGIPLQSGMGSSAASAVAAVVAANALLEQPLDERRLLACALEGERFASGGLHADNAAPCLFGGLVLCPVVLLPDTVSLKVPSGICSVLLHPDLKVNTAEARRTLARSYTMDQWLTQQGYLAAFIAACERDDPELIRKSLHDVIVEPQRAALVPCFEAVKKAALASGALGCSLSGSGPGIFALCPDAAAATVELAMREACRDAGFSFESWISPMASPGACLQHSA